MPGLHFYVVPAESIRAIDVRYFVGPVDVVETNYYAGYSMRQINTTRVCETYVSDECVARKGPEVCVDEQVRCACAQLGHSSESSFMIAVACYPQHMCCPAVAGLACLGPASSWGRKQSTIAAARDAASWFEVPHWVLQSPDVQNHVAAS